MAKSLKHHLLTHFEKAAKHHVTMGTHHADLAEHHAALSKAHEGELGELHGKISDCHKGLGRAHANHAEHLVNLHDQIDKTAGDDLDKAVPDGVRGVIPDNPTRQTDNKLVFRTTPQDQGGASEEELERVPDALKKLVARE
jgi:hypothetical protein